MVVKLKIFKVFCFDSASMKWPLFGIAWALSPKYCLVLQKLPEMKTVFEKSFKILNFGLNGMQLKFTVLVHIGAQYTDGKPKILVKTKISAKTTFSGIINNVTPRSHKNHRIPVKLSHKAFSGPKLGLNYQHGSKGHHKSSHSL